MTTMGTCTSILFFSFGFLFRLVLSSSDFPLGGQVIMPIPPAYEEGFAGRAVLLDALGPRPPGFSAAVSVEARNGEYLCSLILLLGDVKVWASDHSNKFATEGACMLELTANGELRLTDGAKAVGWRSDTAMQGVQRLHLESSTGNLALLDSKNQTIWQSFDNPTDTILWGQLLAMPSYFSAYPANLLAFFSVELDQDKIVAYLNFGHAKYSYWELTPRRNRTMAFARLGSKGLKIFDGRARKIAQILPVGAKPPVRFLSLADDGNLGMYYYSPLQNKFRASYKAMEFCDLPLSCGFHKVCSSNGVCMGFAAETFWPVHGIGFCNASGVEVAMVELKGVSTVLRDTSPLTNLTRQQCVDLCLHSCYCRAALYWNKSRSSTSHGVCLHYAVMAGAREVNGGRFSYWMKVSKGDGRDISNGPAEKVMISCAVIDATALLVIVGASTFYFLRVCNCKRSEVHETENDGTVQN